MKSLPKRLQVLPKDSLARAIEKASNRYLVAESLKSGLGILQSLVSHPAGLVALGSVGLFSWLKLADMIRRPDPTTGYVPYAGTQRQIRLFDDIKKWFQDRQEQLPQPGQGSAR